MTLFLKIFALALCLYTICPSQGQSPNQAVEKVGPNVRPPIPTETPEAIMPEEARLKKINGICVISLVVDSKGETTNVRIVRCTDPIFAENSISAVSRYRFKPAVRIADGAAVPVLIFVEVSFNLMGVPFDANELWAPSLVRYSFLSPPGMSSTAPDARGIYPLSKSLKQPEFAQVNTRSMGALVADFKDGFDCHALLTINAKGVPTSTEQANCDHSEASKAISGFLMKAKFRPSEANGQRVAVRTLVHFSNIGIKHLKKLDPEESQATPARP